MAVTTQDSAQFKRGNEQPYKLLSAVDAGAPKQHFHYDFTQEGAAGDANSIARLVRIPPGRERVNLFASRIAFSAFGAGRTLNIGWEEYTDNQGNTVAANPAGLATGIDVSSAGNAVPTGVVGGAESAIFDAGGAGVVLTAQVIAGTMPQNATLNGSFEVVTPN